MYTCVYTTLVVTAVHGTFVPRVADVPVAQILIPKPKHSGIAHKAEALNPKP